MNFLSALMFYLATFFLHTGVRQGTQYNEAKGEAPHSEEFSAVFYVFSRQILGLFVFSFLLIRKFPVSKITKIGPWVVLRAFSNFAALFAFYQSTVASGASHSNVLNMTYPAFVLVFAWFFLKERPGIKKIILLGLCLCGAILHLLPVSNSNAGLEWYFSEGSFWGILSGALAGLSIVSLRGAAREIHPFVILFWLFLCGSLLSLPLCYQELNFFTLRKCLPVFFSALCGVSAQWLLTLSYGKLEAVTGSLISTVRIPLALFVGLLFLGENFLWNEYTGAGLIFVCNILFAVDLHRGRKKAA